MKQPFTIVLISIGIIMGIVSCKTSVDPVDIGTLAAGNYLIYEIDSNGIKTIVPYDSNYSVTITKKTTSSVGIIQHTSSTKTYSNVSLMDNVDNKISLNYTNLGDTLSGFTQFGFLNYSINPSGKKIIIRAIKQ